MTGLVVAILGLSGAVIGFTRTVLEFLGSRVRHIEPGSGATRLRSLSTAAETYPDAQDLRSDRRFGVLFVVLGTVIATYGLATLLDRPDLQLPRPAEVVAGALLLLEGLALGVIGGHRVRRLRHAAVGRSLHSVAATLVLESDLATALRASLSAMLGIGAIRASGSRVSERDPGVHEILGGTGSWPSHARGNRVSLLLRTTHANCVSIEVVSESFRASLLDSYRNRRNVTHVVEQLLL